MWLIIELVNSVELYKRAALIYIIEVFKVNLKDKKRIIFKCKETIKVKVPKPKKSKKPYCL
jgi:hypothetical protein